MKYIYLLNEFYKLKMTVIKHCFTDQKMNRSNEDRMASQLLVIFCSVLLTSTAKSENSTSKIDLYIGGFFGKNIKAGAWSSAALIPILEMALDHVNNDSNILVDYNLKYVWRDSKVRGIDDSRA